MQRFCLVQSLRREPLQLIKRMQVTPVRSRLSQKPRLYERCSLGKMAMREVFRLEGFGQAIEAERRGRAVAVLNPGFVA
jgi:hypothetical protein